MILNFDVFMSARSMTHDPERLIQIQNHKWAAKLHEQAAQYHLDAARDFEDQLERKYDDCPVDNYLLSTKSINR